MSIASCQQVEEKDYELRAKAVDEEGKPLNGIQVTTGKLEIIRSAPIPAAKPLITDPVLTDEKGMAVLSFKSATGASGNVNFYQDGYYSTMEKVTWAYPDGFEGKRRKGEIQAVIKPVKNPIPMYATRQTERIWIPELNVSYGYDLVKKSPLPPLGVGEHTDFLFKVTGEYRDMESNDLKLEIHFPNPHDGLVEFLTPQRLSMTEPHMEGSELISGYEAPETGYVDRIERTSKKIPSDARKTKDSNHHRNFYFRIRTRLDANGNIESAYYGKIYGDFDFAGGNFSVRGNYASLKWISTYLNPAPNDRNVEFDPKRNLNPKGNVQRP